LVSYIRNRWYCAAWGYEVTRNPFTRTLLNEKIVFYRSNEDEPVALGNVCPHRFAPMHLGKLRGDDIECPYHGLRFSPDGLCAHNPHGELISPSLRVKSYPVVDRYSMVWIWMGNAGEADPDLIPEFPAHDDGGYKTVGGLISVNGSYQLVADNLLDLSHTQYLHPILVVPDDPDTKVEYEIVQDGDTITTEYNQRNTRPFGFTGLIWPDAPERLDGLSGVRWDAPANMLLKLHFVSRDPGDFRELRIWGAELVTPETDTSCHYFWSAARDFRLDDDAFGQQLGDAIANVFTFEDGAMIAEVQANMGGETDLIAMRPVILPTDQAAIRARRIVNRLLRAEQQDEIA
jgi:phenylpropionate dioxygenase-like ring-hydroxylating dioxygenase large terminal subunit